MRQAVAVKNKNAYPGRKLHINGINRSITAGIAIAFVTFIVIYLIMLTAVTPKRYDLSAGDIAPESIAAPRDVEDKLATRQKIEEAKSQVPDFYTLNQSITAAIPGEIHTIFTSIANIRDKSVDEIQSFSIETGIAFPTSLENKRSFLETWINSTHGKEFIKEIEKTVPVDITNEDIISIIMADNQELDRLEITLTTLLTDILEDGIKTEQLPEFRIDIENEINNMDIDDELKVIGSKVGLSVLKANLLYDPERTMEEKEKAAAQVEKVMLRKGQFIVQAGQPVTEQQIAILKDLGLIKDDYVDVPLFVGIGIVILAVIGFISMYLIFFERDIAAKPRNVLMISACLCLALGLSYITSIFNHYFLPLAMGGMLLTILLNSRIGTVVNVALALLAGLMMELHLGVVVVALVGGMAGICFVKNMRNMNTLVRSGFGISGLNLFVVSGYEMITRGVWASTNTLWGIAGGMLAVIMTIGTLPFWENIFNVLTSTKLLELANPNHPALKQLLMDAPGTYHHSIIVASLAENAADAVGANGLLARVGAYYHDLGKVKKPYYYKENQLYSDNPHDRMTPERSVKIITNHTLDGVELAKKYKVPSVIHDFILQHHGTTPVIYFYFKAKNMYGDDVKLDNYRYKGPIPQTREAAIVMMADTVEAAVRSQPEHSKDKIEVLIRRLIKDKLDDGQLYGCDLTLKDLDKIADAFRSVLVGIFHERINYPEVQYGEDKEHDENDSVN